jgi:hypothetical protein
LVQAFLKKWWVESDFKAPNLPLSLRLKGSGCHYNSIIKMIKTTAVKIMDAIPDNKMKSSNYEHNTRILLQSFSISFSISVFCFSCIS